MSSSCTLFYGPGALLELVKEANLKGYLFKNVFGSEGLKVEEARELSEVITHPPFMGDKPLVVQVGPLDMANRKALDALLKPLEEFNSTRVLPLLWAKDLTNITETILSRVISVWCPGGGLDIPSSEDLKEAKEVLSSFNLKRYEVVCGILTKHKESQKLLQNLIYLLGNGHFNMRLWSSIRPLQDIKDLHCSALLSSILEASDE